MKDNEKKTVKIRTNLWTGIVFGVISAVLLIVTPSQVRVPAFDSGAPSPRVLPSICLWIMLFCSVYLLVESLVFKKEKIYEWDATNELPILIIIGCMLIFVACARFFGFVPGGLIALTLVLVYLKEKKLPVYIFTWICVIGIYFMFKNIFNISLPSVTTSLLWKLIGG